MPTSRANSSGISGASTAVATSAPAAVSATSPWTTVGRRRSRTASRSASTGCVRPARAPARQAPTRATPTPQEAAIAHPVPWLGIASRTGVTPAWCRMRSTGTVTAVPSRQPATVPTAATASASPSSRVRTWRGVAPSRRSRPSSRRRVATTNPKVEETTKSARKSEMPAMIPNNDPRSSICVRVCGSSPSVAVPSAPSMLVARVIRAMPPARATAAPAYGGQDWRRLFRLCATIATGLIGPTVAR